MSGLPKLPGRESTRLVYSLDSLVVASFLMHTDRYVGTRKCVVRGCDHLAGNCMSGDASGPAVVVNVKNVDEQRGLACQCCVAKIIDLPY